MTITARKNGAACPTMLADELLESKVKLDMMLVKTVMKPSRNKSVMKPTNIWGITPRFIPFPSELMTARS